MPSDPFFDEMSDWDLLWMAEMINQDDRDEYNRKKSFTDYLASFINPDAVQKVLDAEKSTVKVSEENFKKTLDMLDKHIDTQVRLDG